MSRSKHINGLKAGQEDEMFKFMAFIGRRPDITPEQFKHYYENNHVPLVLKLFGESWKKAKVYRRNYLNFDQPLVEADGRQGVYMGFDVVTEVIFETREEAMALLDPIHLDPENFKIVLEDENNFIDRGKSKYIIVDAQETDFAEIV